MKTVIILLFFATLWSCKKSSEICRGYSGTQPGFKIYEYVLDTALATDTSFVDKDIFFKANEAYSAIAWAIGADPRSFNTANVNLRFPNPESLNVTLRAGFINGECNTQQFTRTKPFVLVKNDGSIQSPLVGAYNGFNADAPNDNFTVTIKFWIGARYNWWSYGAYSVDNLPKGYSDTTKNFNGYNRPEITGIMASIGYKNIAIDKSGNIPTLGIKGYGSLSRGIKDTLTFNYTIIDTGYLNRTGNIKYIIKKFIGIKN